jgi:MFS superfamily sulfate permease-like transporter
VLTAGGLAIGALMLLLAATGTLAGIARVVPKPVIRGIQAGLGLQLGMLALTKFVPQDGTAGFIVAGIAFVIALALLGNRKIPPALVLVALGLGWAAVTWPTGAGSPLAFHIPHVGLTWPDKGDWSRGILLLALPQIALSLGNSVLATRQIAMDLFPSRTPPTVTRIGLTYAAMNLTAPVLGGVPVCHGSGGMAGHYMFGGRTGGSTIIYGVFYIVSALLLAGNPTTFAALFPPPILGVLLVFEAIALLSLLRDLTDDSRAFRTALFCGLAAVTLPYGYVVALVGGTVVWHAVVRLRKARPF